MAKKKSPAVGTKQMFLVIDGEFYDVRRPATDRWNGVAIDPSESFVLKKANGGTYLVTPSGCSCPHFCFHHSCKHINALREYGVIESEVCSGVT